jgi:hypothetical protein
MTPKPDPSTASYNEMQRWYRQKRNNFETRTRSGETHPRYSQDRETPQIAYYEKNRDALLEKKREKVTCPGCSKVVNRVYLPKHVCKSSYHSGSDASHSDDPCR